MAAKTILLILGGQNEDNHQSKEPKGKDYAIY